MAEETKKKAHHSEKLLDKMTVKELREIALEFPHDKAIHGMKKEELIDLIKEVKGIKGDVQAKAPQKAVKVKMTKSQVKANIRELKKLKLQAQEAQDFKKANMIRLRISTLKKKTRKMVAV